METLLEGSMDPPYMMVWRDVSDILLLVTSSVSPIFAAEIPHSYQFSYKIFSESMIHHELFPDIFGKSAKQLMSRSFETI